MSVLTCHIAYWESSSEELYGTIVCYSSTPSFNLKFQGDFDLRTSPQTFYFLSMAAKAADRVITGAVIGDGHL
ncbi:hypothetical protein N7510_003207 [Penicillium lagena]|uniref:uncharacterized protein n=1 Tax=Penicillium lagena TaxID=94218 RepID=UPI00254002B8|nr:uncharacterized protein N7510_003207 [Penicillium lagena]KAJ5619223.1 hypothetical protein N7510_003207 [Penicillium lagena]